MEHITQDKLKTRKLHHWRSLVLVLGLLFGVLIILTAGGGGEQGAPPKNGATTETWTIEDGDNVVRENEVLSLGGHLLITGDGSLTLSNTTLIYDKHPSFPTNDWIIEVYGSLHITNGSEIEAPWEGRIISHTNSECILEHSEINDVKIAFDSTTIIQDCEMKNLRCINVISDNITITDNKLQFRDEYFFNSIPQHAIWFGESEEFLLSRNTIQSRRAVTAISCANGIISENTFRMDEFNRGQMVVAYSHDIDIKDNVFELNCSQEKYPGPHTRSLQINYGSQNITVIDNSFHSMQSGGWGIAVTENGYNCEIRHNTFDNYEISVGIVYLSNNCTVEENTIKNSVIGVWVTNGSYEINVYENTFDNVTYALFQRNSIPINHYSNEFQDVQWEYWRDSELTLHVNDTKSQPLENCNVTIFDGFNDIVYQGKTDYQGTIPWLALVNETRDSEGSKYYNPYRIEVEKWGKQNSTIINLPQSTSMLVMLQLDIIIDVNIVIQSTSSVERGNNLHINITIENRGTINITTSQLFINFTFDSEGLTVSNHTFDKVTSGMTYYLNESHFLGRDLSIGKFWIESEMICTFPYVEIPFEWFDIISLDIINSPPTIDERLKWEQNTTANKNQMISIDVWDYVHDFEDDPDNLTLELSNLYEFKEVVIPSDLSAVLFIPNDHYHGSIVVDIEVMDRDGGKFILPIRLRWINHEPQFFPLGDFSWYSSEEDIQLNLSELAYDEDINELLVWEFRSDDHYYNNIHVTIDENILHVTRINDELILTVLDLLVSDGSNVNTTQQITILWEADVFIEVIEIVHENDDVMQNETVDVMITLINSKGVSAKGHVMLYLNSEEDLIVSQLIEIKENSTQLITLPWKAIVGDHDLIVKLVVESPHDRNDTRHLVYQAIEVFEDTVGFFPLIMTCDNVSSVIVLVGGEGSTVHAEVFAPSFKSIENVTIILRTLSLNGEITDHDPLSGELNGGTEIAEGIIIIVTPNVRSIEAATSGYFHIIIQIDNVTNYSQNDLIELCLYAEGDDGRSNDVVLHVTVQVESEKSTTTIPFLKQTTVILIIGLFILPLVVVKASSALSNSFYSMYRLSRFVFLAFPNLFMFLCPLYAKQNEVDEALHNEYRDKICEFLYARGEQGGTTQDIMKFLKMWFPYGTTGDADPENNNVTGVVRQHILFLVKKKYIRELGGRYYYRSYKPSLPEEIYNPSINWNSLLKNGTTKLKNETICKMISAIYSSGKNGMRNKELAGIMDMTPYAVYYHMKNLENAKLIEKRRGMGKRYFINDNIMAPFLNGDV